MPTPARPRLKLVAPKLKPPPPQKPAKTDFGAAGRALWQALNDKYRSNDVTVIEQIKIACRAADIIADADDLPASGVVLRARHQANVLMSRTLERLDKKHRTYARAGRPGNGGTGISYNALDRFDDNDDDSDEAE